MLEHYFRQRHYSNTPKFDFGSQSFPVVSIEKMTNFSFDRKQLHEHLFQQIWFQLERTIRINLCHMSKFVLFVWVYKQWNHDNGDNGIDGFSIQDIYAANLLFGNHKIPPFCNAEWMNLMLKWRTDLEKADILCPNVNNVFELRISILMSRTNKIQMKMEKKKKKLKNWTPGLLCYVSLPFGPNHFRTKNKKKT